ncbi:MAG: S41 family peptidase [Acidobacteriota bacterium]
MSRSRLILLCASFTLLLLLLTGAVLGRSRSNDSVYGGLKIFNEALHYVQSNYVEKVETKQLMDGAYQGLVATLDSDSEYFDSRQAKKLSEPPGPADVGITPVRRGLIMRVLSVRAGSAAARAGVEPGWFIRLIDGRLARELSASRVLRALSGAPGSTVECTLYRPGDPKKIELELQRERRPQAPAILTEPRPGVAHLRLLWISEDAARAVRVALKDLPSETRLLLDLRNNPGGSYEEAIRVANLFIPEGVIARLRDRQKERSVYEARKRDHLWDAPVSILVNRGTAGAAELIAAALHGRGRARLLGEKTAGVGSFQESLPLPDGGVLRLSVAKYQDPGSKSWHETGVSPDEVLTPPEAGAEGDWLLEEALERITEAVPEAA